MKHLKIDLKSKDKIGMQNFNMGVNSMYGLESIAFQDGSYFRETVEMIEKFRSGHLTLLAISTAFATITAKHTGIWVDVSFSDYLEDAYIAPNWLCSANSLASPACRQYEMFTRMGFKAGEKPISAFINDKTSKVGGFLKDIENKMVMSKDFYTNNKFSPEFVAAIMLHEVGHAYTFFQYSIRMMVFNVALTQASQNLSKARNYEEVKIIFKETCDYLDINNTEFIVETKNTENRVTQFTYLASNIGKLYSAFPNMDVSNKFTQDAAEELADIFVARHGGERGVMENRQYYNNSPYNTSSTITAMAISFSGLLLTITGSIMSSFILGPYMMIFGVVHAMVVAKDLYSDFKFVSKTIGITNGYKQIRKMQNQLIERLKASKKPDKDLINAVHESIVYGDKLLTTVSSNDNLSFTILSFFNSNMRDGRAIRLYQDQLEALVSNRLFLSANRFVV